MKRLKCPYCGKEIQDVVDVFINLPLHYYLKREKWGAAPSCFWRGIMQMRKKKKWYKITALGCRFCGMSFKKEFEKEVWTYIEQRHILKQLI